MFRARTRSETPSRPTARRGSVGSARVWDERTRAQCASTPPSAPPESAQAPPAPAPLALPREELASLVAGIVQLTLDTRLADHEPARRTELARELQSRLLALFGCAPPSAAQARRCGAEVSSARCPAVLPRAAEDAAHSTLPGGCTAASAPTLGVLLEDRLLRLGGALALRADLRERLIGLALQRLTSASEVPTASGEELRSLDVLQRRTAKLERSLQEARSALAYVSGMQHVDAGIASIYRAVQGLSLEDPQRDSKRAALESLFHANLTLQQPPA